MNSGLIPSTFYYKSNRLQQLRGFYYTIQTGSVSKAAEVMMLNQSTVSMQISSLERDLNIKLFERKGSFLKPTSNAVTLYNLALPHIEGINNLYERFFLENKKEHLSTLTIAADHISTLYLLPNIINEYAKLNPKIKIKICNISTSEATQRFLEDKIHLIIAKTPEATEEFEHTVIRECSPILITAKGSALAQKKKVSLADIAKHPFINVESSSAKLPTLEAIAKQYNFSSNISFEAGDILVLKKFVKAGVANAIIPDIAYNKEEDKTIHTIAMDEYCPTISYGITLRKGKFVLPQVEEFIKIIHPDFSRSGI